MTTPATQTQPTPRARRQKPEDDAAAQNPNILCHQIGLCRNLAELQAFISKHELLNVADDARFDASMRVVIDEALDTMSEVLQNPGSADATLFPVPADLAAKGWAIERDGVLFRFRKGQLSTDGYVIRSEAADAARKLHSRNGKGEGKPEFVEPTVTEVTGPTLKERTEATLELRAQLKEQGWKFKEYADGRVAFMHKARGLMTAKHDSMVEAIHEAGRLAEEQDAEIEGDRAALDSAPFVPDEHVTLGDGALGDSVQTVDAEGLEAEPQTSANNIPQNIPPEGVGEAVEATPATDDAPAEPSLKDKLVERHNGNANGNSPRRVVQELYVEITPERRTELLEELRQQAKELGRAAAKLDAAKSEYKSAEKRIELRQKIIDAALDRGSELRPVECREVFDFGLKLALTYRTDTYDEVERRPMTKSELQPPLISM